MHWCSYFFVFIMSVTAAATTVASSCSGASVELNPGDCTAFAALRNMAPPTSWLASNCTSEDPCACSAVSAGETGDTCDENDIVGGVCCEAGVGDDLRITRLTLHHAELAGELPSLALLSSLRFLDVDGNALTGGLDNAAFGTQHTQLEALYLGGSTNHLEGTIPESIGALPSLTVFDIDGQSYGSSSGLTGTVPQGFADRALVDLKLKFTGLGGILPAMNFSNLVGNCYWKTCCDLGGTTFACPLPEGAAEHCNATCA